MIEGALWRRWVFYNIPLILFVFVLLFPFYWMIITTFRPDGELYRPWNAANYMPFWTNNPTLEHIVYLFEETNFMRWMFNTMFIALVSTVISLFCGVLAGYALARLNFPYAGGLGTAIFITYLVPQTLLFIPLAEIIRNFQLGDTPWSLILTYPTFLIPFCTWLMMGYFKAIPKELEECARIDGVRRAGRPVGLRQVHAAAHDRRARGHHRRRDRIGGRVVNDLPPQARHRHGVPELRALPAHDGAREHGLRR
jgi:multiple sugar transport system permease protein